MKTFNIETIRSLGPCYDPEKHLSNDWQGNIIDILDIKDCDFSDRLWVIMRTDFVSEKLMRLFAVWCARQVQHLMKDERSLKALDVAEAYANYYTLIDDSNWREGWDLERVAARDAAGAAARDAARASAWAAARAAARASAWAAARAAADAADAAAWIADARADTRAAQEQQLRKMILKGIDTGDVVMNAEDDPFNKRNRVRS